MTEKEFAELRETILNVSDKDSFMRLLVESLSWDPSKTLKAGSFEALTDVVISDFASRNEMSFLIAALAAAYPLEGQLVTLFREHAARVDKTWRAKVEEAWAKEMEKRGLVPAVEVQDSGAKREDGLEIAVTSLPYVDHYDHQILMWRLGGRVCRVEIDDNPVGTGFLVGPDLILTNYHVVESVPKTESGNKIKARFDCWNEEGRPQPGRPVTAAASKWLLADSPYTKWEKDGKPEQEKPTEKELDFALIRLSERVGEQPLDAALHGSVRRGWINLPTALPPLKENAALIILQHPKGQPLKKAEDSWSLVNPANYWSDKRLRYRTNTEPGSSGSPVFTPEGHLVALHHFGRKVWPEGAKTDFNQGITITAITALLKNKGFKLQKFEEDGGWPWKGGESSASGKHEVPYPGLRSFEIKESNYFFGRGPELTKLADKWRLLRDRGDKRLLLLHGVSGSGKSSLLKAGLLAYLEDERREEDWIVLPVVRAGDAEDLKRVLGDLWRPARKLMAAARRAREAEATAVAATAGPVARRAAKATRRIKEWVREFEAVAGARVTALREERGRQEAQVVVAIDQLEEVFLLPDRKVQERFVVLLEELLALRVEGRPAVMGIGTVRSSELTLVMQQLAGSAPEDYLVLPLAREALPEIISEPARMAGLSVKTELVVAIVRDAPTSDMLPLVAFLLKRLYELGEGRNLEMEHYNSLRDHNADLNPLETCIREVALKAVGPVPRGPEPKPIKALREAFIGGLVRVDGVGSHVRGRLAVVNVPEAARPLIGRLVDEHLLVKSEDNILEVAHEALFRVWPLLVKWLAEERHFLEDLVRIEAAVKEWRSPEHYGNAALHHQSTRGTPHLTGSLLVRAERWLVEHPQRLAGDPERLIRESARVRDAAEAEHQSLIDEMALAREEMVRAREETLLEREATTKAKEEALESEKNSVREREAAAQSQEDAAKAKEVAARAKEDRTKKVLAAAVITAVLAVVAVFQWWNARGETKRAEGEALKAQTQKEIAEGETKRAEGEALKAKTQKEIAEGETKKALEATNSAQEALATSFFRSIGRSEGINGVEQMSLWELMELAPLNEPVREKLLNAWFGENGDPAPAFRNGAAGLRAAVGVVGQRLDISAACLAIARRLGDPSVKQDWELQSLEEGMFMLSPFSDAGDAKVMAGVLFSQLLRDEEKNRCVTLGRVLDHLQANSPKLLSDADYRRLLETLKKNGPLPPIRNIPAVHKRETLPFYPYWYSNLARLLAGWDPDSEDARNQELINTLGSNLVEAMRRRMPTLPLKWTPSVEYFDPEGLCSLAEALATIGPLLEGEAKGCLADSFELLSGISGEDTLSLLNKVGSDRIGRALTALIQDPDEEWCRKIVNNYLVKEIWTDLEGGWGRMMAAPLTEILRRLDGGRFGIRRDLAKRLIYSAGQDSSNGPIEVMLEEVLKRMVPDDRYAIFREIMGEWQGKKVSEYGWSAPSALLRSIKFEAKGEEATELFQSLVTIIRKNDSEDVRKEARSAAIYLAWHLPARKEVFESLLRTSPGDMPQELVDVIIHGYFEKVDPGEWHAAGKTLANELLKKCHGANAHYEWLPGYEWQLEVKRLVLLFRKSGLNQLAQTTAGDMCQVLVKGAEAEASAEDAFAIAKLAAEFFEESGSADGRRRLLTALHGQVLSSNRSIEDAAPVRDVNERFPTILKLAAGISAEELTKEAKQGLESIVWISDPSVAEAAMDCYLGFLIEQLSTGPVEPGNLYQRELEGLFSLAKPSRAQNSGLLENYLKAVAMNLVAFNAANLDQIMEYEDDWPSGKELSLFYYAGMSLVIGAGDQPRPLAPALKEYLRPRVKQAISQAEKSKVSDLEIEELKDDAGLKAVENQQLNLNVLVRLFSILGQMDLPKEKMQILRLHREKSAAGLDLLYPDSDVAAMLPEVPPDFPETRKHLALEAMERRLEDNATDSTWIGIRQDLGGNDWTREELLEMLLWSGCRDRNRDDVLRQLEQQYKRALTGKNFAGNYVKFLQLAPSLGIQDLGKPAKRPSYESMVKEIEEWNP